MPARGSRSGCGVRQLERALVEHRGPAAGQAHHGSKPAVARGAHRIRDSPATTTSRLENATQRPGRASRSVSGSSPAATRSMSARDTAVSSAGSSGKERFSSGAAGSDSPSANFASSLISSGVQAGVKVIFG